MKKFLLLSALVAVLFFGCVESKHPDEKKNESAVNQTVHPSKDNRTAAKIPLSKGELPKLVKGKGVAGTAKQTRDLAKQSVLNYSDSFAFFIYGNNIDASGKNDENNFWTILLITPDVVGAESSYLSATSGTIYTTRSDYRIGEEPGQYLKAIPKFYPLEKDNFIDSDKALAKAIPEMEKAVLKQINQSGATVDLRANLFDLTYYDNSLKVYTVYYGRNWPVTLCMDTSGEIAETYLVNQGMVDCSRIVNTPVNSTPADSMAVNGTINDAIQG